MLHLQAGATVGRARRRAAASSSSPARVPASSLDELLAQCDASAEALREDRAWLAASRRAMSSSSGARRIYLVSLDPTPGMSARHAPVLVCLAGAFTG